MHLLDAGTQRLDIARYVQLHGGLAYESKAVAAKSYSDATLGTASFIHQETSDLPTLFTTIKFCEFCNEKGHDIVECHDRIRSGNPKRKYINLKKKETKRKNNKKEITRMENIALYTGNQDTQLKNVSLMKVLTMDHISKRHKTDPKKCILNMASRGILKKDYLSQFLLISIMKVSLLYFFPVFIVIF